MVVMSLLMVTLCCFQVYFCYFETSLNYCTTNVEVCKPYLSLKDDNFLRELKEAIAKDYTYTV